MRCRQHGGGKTAQHRPKGAMRQADRGTGMRRLAKLTAAARWAGTVMLVLAMVVLPVQQASARGISLVRDAEIERTLAMMTSPLLTAAGMSQSSINMFIVNADSLNAFVAGGPNVFLHTGLISRLDRPEELQAVIAHELGHIAGGHLARRQIALQQAQGPALLGMALGIAAAVAGAGPAGLGLGLGTQEALRRGILRYSRSEEASADQAAISYMKRAGINPSGLRDVVARFRGQEVLTFGSLDPYTQTHPLSTQRMQLIDREATAAESRSWPQNPEVDYWHARARAKLRGFLSNPRRVLSEDEDKPETEFILYARAVAQHRLPDLQSALGTMDELMAMRPNDAYYHELRGQILYESGNAEAALPAYRRANALAPNTPLLMSGLGRVLLALGGEAETREALKTLEAARRSDPGDLSMLRSLAIAYDRTGNRAMATLVTAERFAATNRREDAVLHASRAVQLLPEGSPGWLRAQDILAMK